MRTLILTTLKYEDDSNGEVLIRNHSHEYGSEPGFEQSILETFIHDVTKAITTCSENGDKRIEVMIFSE